MSKSLDIKTMVGGGKKVRLERVQSGAITYVTETGFKFQVPVDELGDAPAYPEEPAMTYMKWIKRAIAAALVEDAAEAAPEEVSHPPLSMKVLTVEDVEKK